MSEEDHYDRTSPEEPACREHISSTVCQDAEGAKPKLSFLVRNLSLNVSIRVRMDWLAGGLQENLGRTKEKLG